MTSFSGGLRTMTGGEILSRVLGPVKYTNRFLFGHTCSYQDYLHGKSIYNNPLSDELFFCEVTFSLYIPELNLPYPQFCRVFSPQTSRKCPFLQPSSTRSWLKPHPPINELAVVTALSRQLLAQTGINASLVPCRAEDCFLNPFVHRRTAVAHLQPTKAFSKRSPETAMLSAPNGYTYPLPPILPFLLKQNLSREVIAGSDVTRGKLHAGYIRLHPGNG